MAHFPHLNSSTKNELTPNYHHMTKIPSFENTGRSAQNFSNQERWRNVSVNFAIEGYKIRETKRYYTAEYQKNKELKRLATETPQFTSTPIKKQQKDEEILEKCRFHCGQTFQNGAGLKEHEITHMQLVLTLHQKHKDKLFSEKAKTISRNGLKFRNQQKAPKPFLKNNQNRRGKPY